MPIAAFTMACLLFVYARTSIRLAKENAQLHREADGGQISWRNQALRQHGHKEEAVSGLKMDGMKVVYEKKEDGGSGPVVPATSDSSQQKSIADMVKERSGGK